MAKKPGVYPVYENQFQVGADSSSLSDIARIAVKDTG